MKIIHVVCGLAPDAGGPGIIAASLASAQARLGHNVILLGNYNITQEASVKKTFAQFAGIERVQIVNTLRSGLLEHLLPFRGWRLLRSLIEKDSVVHLHGVWDPLLHLAYILARRRQAHHVVMPHSMLHPWELRRHRWLKKLWIVAEIRNMLTSAVFVHAGTDAEAGFLQALAPRAKVVIIPNGIFPEQTAHRPSPGEFYKHHPELDNCPYVLFLSRLHYQKGLSYLAAAFEILSRSNTRIRLVVAGPDRGERQNFLNSIARKGLQSRVHLLGPLYGQDKAMALNDALCFCLPSLNEGFSMAVLEALACGIPAVISEHCFFPEVAIAQAGFVVPLDAHRISKAIEALAADPALRNRMGRNARQLVVNSYAWDVLAKKTLDAYSERGSVSVN